MSSEEGEYTGKRMQDVLPGRRKKEDQEESVGRILEDVMAFGVKKSVKQGCM